MDSAKAELGVRMGHNRWQPDEVVLPSVTRSPEIKKGRLLHPDNGLDSKLRPGLWRKGDFETRPPNKALVGLREQIGPAAAMHTRARSLPALMCVC
jgi:hypothetical protein